jgi:hypothetical protein
MSCICTVVITFLGDSRVAIDVPANLALFLHFMLIFWKTWGKYGDRDLVRWVAKVKRARETETGDTSRPAPKSGISSDATFHRPRITIRDGGFLVEDHLR